MTSDVEQVQDPKLYNAIKDRGTAYLMVFRELARRTAKTKRSA